MSITLPQKDIAKSLSLGEQDFTSFPNYEGSEVGKQVRLSLPATGNSL